jgi:hypothetical protein
MSLVQFLKDAAWNGAGSDEHGLNIKAKVTVVYRPDVASRMWWTIRWTGEDKQQREASAQELDLALWRAAEMEEGARAERRRKEESSKGTQPG